MVRGGGVYGDFDYGEIDLESWRSEPGRLVPHTKSMAPPKEQAAGRNKN